MAATPDHVPVIAHAIQLAVAPVFLLTGVAALLAVMTQRLARIIDRSRYFDQAWDRLTAAEMATAPIERGALEKRRRLASWAINFCTLAALLVCGVITTLFVDAFFATDLKALAGGLFIASMFALIAGLACFLREVYLATTTVRAARPKARRTR